MSIAPETHATLIERLTTMHLLLPLVYLDKERRMIKGKALSS